MAPKMRFEAVGLNDLTRRERSRFEHESGMNWVELMRVVTRINDEGGDLSAMESYTDFEAAMLAVAVRRKLGAQITFDEVLDNDGWDFKEAVDPKGVTGDGQAETSMKTSKKT